MDGILQLIKKAGKTAFRTKEYAALLNKSKYARLVLHRLKEKGELVRIKNGWWAFANSAPEAIAVEVSKPAYLSFHSALFLHGLTTQIPSKIQLAVSRKVKNYSFDSYSVKEFKIKKNEFTAFFRKGALLIASAEKALADAISYPRSCPEVVLIESLKKIDLTKINEFLHTKAAKKRLKRLIRYAKSERSE